MSGEEIRFEKESKFKKGEITKKNSIEKGSSLKSKKPKKIKKRKDGESDDEFDDDDDEFDDDDDVSASNSEILYYKEWHEVFLTGKNLIWETYVKDSFSYFKMYRNKTTKKLSKVEWYIRGKVEEIYSFEYNDDDGLLKSITLKDNDGNIIRKKTYYIRHYEKWRKIAGKGKGRTKWINLDITKTYYRVYYYKTDKIKQKKIEKCEIIKDDKVLNTFVYEVSNDNTIRQIRYYDKQFQIIYRIDVDFDSEREVYSAQEYRIIEYIDREKLFHIANHRADKFGLIMRTTLYTYFQDPEKNNEWKKRIFSVIHYDKVEYKTKKGKDRTKVKVVRRTLYDERSRVLHDYRYHYDFRGRLFDKEDLIIKKQYD